MLDKDFVNASATSVATTIEFPSPSAVASPDGT
jgi:hypothetical protein